MHFVPTFLLISVVGICFCEHDNETNETKTSSTLQTPNTDFMHSTKSSSKPLQTTVPLRATQTTQKTFKTTKGYASTDSTTTTRKTTTQVYSTSTKNLLKSARRQKLNTTSSAPGSTIHTATRLQDRLGAIDCDLPVLPRESRLWRGNETHELHLPVTVSLIIIINHNYNRLIQF